MCAFVEWGSCHFRLGEVLLSVGDVKGALRSFQRAVAFSPDQTEYQVRLEALEEQADLDEDTPSGSNPEVAWVTRGGGPARVWIELRNVSCTASLDLGTELWRSSEALAGGDVGVCYAEQQQLLEAALSVVASNTGFATLEGVLEAGLERFDLSRRAFVCLALGNILAWVGDNEGAASFYSSGIDAVPSAGVRQELWLGVLLCNRAYCKLRLGDTNGALGDAERCLKMRPDWHKAHTRLGCIKCEAGQWQAAAAHFHTGLALAGGDTAESVDANSRMCVANLRGRTLADGPALGENSAGDARGARTHSEGSLNSRPSRTATRDSAPTLLGLDGDDSAGRRRRMARVRRPSDGAVQAAAMNRQASAGSGAGLAGLAAGSRSSLDGYGSAGSLRRAQEDPEARMGAIPRKRSKQELEVTPEPDGGGEHASLRPPPSQAEMLARTNSRSALDMGFDYGLDAFGLSVTPFPLQVGKGAGIGGRNWAGTGGGAGVLGDVGLQNTLDGDDFLLDWDVGAAFDLR